MLQDLKDIEPGTTLNCDLCICGAGAAGLTLARAFSGSGLEIVLLESGGLDFEAEIQALGAGDNIGMPYYALNEARLRFFGGTTNIWGGRCSPLDDIDFERRPWVPHSGWPINPEDLRSGYERAHSDLEIGEFCYGPELWSRIEAAPLDFEPDRLDYRFWRFDELKERFSAGRCRDLLDARNVRVITHASVSTIETSPEANRVLHLEARAAGGGRVRVTAQAYVLACGGIENARLLLASRGVEREGVGNRHDQVGRYFMEHPHGRLGLVSTPRPHGLWNRLRPRFPAGGVPVAPALGPAPALQRERGILNTVLTLKLQRDPSRGVALGNRLYQELKSQLDPTRRNRLLWHCYRSASMAYKHRLRPIVEQALVRLPGRALCVMVRGEQAPNRDSRVVLSERRDSHGMPVADLDWQLSPIDKHTLRELAGVFDAELRRLELGRLEPESWIYDDDHRWPLDPTVGNHPIGGYHHMGTTRMSSDPRTGVVDADCRVHGYANLYVAGSSVFSTGGWANPTLTILALAHRLHDHLMPRLKRCAATGAAEPSGDSRNPESERRRAPEPVQARRR